jgi:hypothetical protein
VDVDQLLESPPRFHLTPQGTPWRWEVLPELLRVIDPLLDEQSRTLETGAGLSTAFFAVKECAHTCVVPSFDQIERIRRWCASNGVSPDRITFHSDRSESVLPTLDPTPLDLVLIDGGHGFPTPFVDWHYAGRRLRLGGLLIVDDIQLWTGSVLRQYLLEQPGWELRHELAMHSVIFERTGDEGPVGEWVDQPFVARRSYSSASLRGRARIALALARRREFRALWRRARQRRG